MSPVDGARKRLNFLVADVLFFLRIGGVAWLRAIFLIFVPQGNILGSCAAQSTPALAYMRPSTFTIVPCEVWYDLLAYELAVSYVSIMS